MQGRDGAEEESLEAKDLERETLHALNLEAERARRAQCANASAAAGAAECGGGAGGGGEGVAASLERDGGEEGECNYDCPDDPDERERLALFRGSNCRRGRPMG